MTIEQIIQKVYPINEASRDSIKHCVAEVDYSKGQLLFKANKIESNIYFIKKGIVRAYSNQEEKQITFWFGEEGDPVVSMKSYVLNQKSYENVEALEDCKLFQIEKVKLEKLFEEDINIANWGRKFAELELIRAEERLISLQFGKATERYLALIENHPNLILRVPLGHIASYLGISQVSLSRIRAAIG